MWFGLLGEFVVLDESGRAADVGPPQRRELLAFLLSNSNRAVSVDAIAEALWPAEAPAAAKTSIQSHVSRLRRILGPERIATRSAGYLLRVATDGFDILDFLESVERGRRLIDEGSHRGAFAELSRGLTLWRGDPLWDFYYADWAQIEISHLENVRRAVVHTRFELALRMGMHGHVLAELALASERDPGHEGLARLHAIALYRSGQQQASVNRLEALRRHLANEIGLDVSPETVELESAVLDHDARLMAWTDDRASLSDTWDAETGTRPLQEMPVSDGDGERERQAMISPWGRPTAGSRVAYGRRSNLPAALTSFVGRAREIAELAALVRGRRLVTITGPAGVGKTRLALELAGELADDPADDLADGVWLVELGPIQDPDLIQVEVLRALGVGRDDDDSRQLLLETLSDRRLLLVVDTCEHLVDSVAFLVEAILKRAPGVRILATSREPLGIPGEFRRPLAPLVVPDVGSTADWGRLVDESDAVHLFLDRASAVQPLELNASTGPSIVEVCRRLDGLPLALELAAAQLDHLSIEELAAELATHLSDLQAPYRTVPDRQRAIRDAVGWSSRMISPDEQCVLRRLAVFAGDFDRDDAQAAIGFAPLPDEVTSLLDRLVTRSLVAAGVDGRLRLLKVIAEVARDELHRAHEEATVLAAHARHYLARAGEAQAHMRGPDQVEWLERLSMDWRNTRAALEWALVNDTALGTRAVIGLTDYFRLDHGWEGMEWTERYLARVSDPRGVMELHRTRALAAMISSVHHVMTESAEYLLAHADDDAGLVSDALLVLAMKAVETTDRSAIAPIKARMGSIVFATPREQRQQATIEAIDSVMREDLEGAASWMRRSIDLTRETGESWATVGAMTNLADTLMRLGRLEEALESVDHAVATGRKVGSRVMLAFSLITRGQVMDRIGRFEEGLASALEGLVQAHQVVSRFEVVQGSEVSAVLLLELGRLDEAAALHAFGHASAERWGQVGLLSQLSDYHDRLVSGLAGLSEGRRDGAARRAADTPLPVLVAEMAAAALSPLAS